LDGEEVKNWILPILAWLLVALTLILITVSLFILWLDRSGSMHAQDVGGSKIPSLMGTTVIALVGGLIASRKPRNAYGWVCLVTGFCFTCTSFIQVYTSHSLNFEIAFLGDLSWLAGATMSSFLLLLFPNGHYPNRRWRFVGWPVLLALSAGIAFGFAILILSGGSPVIFDGSSSGGDSIGEITLFVLNISLYAAFTGILLGAVSLFFRYRVANATERQQLRWFAYVASIFCISVFSPFIFEFSGMFELVRAVIMFTSLPIAIGIAILRYRLFDIDLIIRKTLVYAALTITLALVFFGGVALLQQVVGRITGMEDSPVAIVISTLLIAALFSPLRRRIQDLIDRRFYRQKYNAEQALADFAATARNETDLEALTGKLVEVVSQTVQPEQVVLWLRPGKKS
jgi:hypothetical protein